MLNKEKSKNQNIRVENKLNNEEKERIVRGYLKF